MTKDEKKKIRLQIQRLLDNPTEENLEKAKKLGKILSPSADEKPIVKRAKSKVVAKEIVDKNLPKRAYGSDIIIDLNQYIQLRNEGFTQKEVAEKINISLKLLTLELERARRRGLLESGQIVRKHRDRKGLTKEKYLQYKKDGITDAKIIKKYRLCTSAITDLKNDWGIPVKDYKKAIPKEKIINYLKLGLKAPEIAKLEGHSNQTIYNTLKRYGIDKVKTKQIRMNYLRTLKNSGGIA